MRQLWLESVPRVLFSLWLYPRVSLSLWLCAALPFWPLLHGRSLSKAHPFLRSVPLLFHHRATVPSRRVCPTRATTERLVCCRGERHAAAVDAPLLPPALALASILPFLTPIPPALGRIYNVSKRAVGIIVNKRIKNRYLAKRINVRIEHLQHSKCRLDFHK